MEIKTSKLKTKIPSTHPYKGVSHFPFPLSFTFKNFLDKQTQKQHSLTPTQFLVNSDFKYPNKNREKKNAQKNKINSRQLRKFLVRIRNKKSKPTEDNRMENQERTYRLQR